MALVLFLDVAGVPSAFKDQMKSHGDVVENEGKWFLRDPSSERDQLNPEAEIAYAYAARPLQVHHYITAPQYNCQTNK